MQRMGWVVAAVSALAGVSLVAAACGPAAPTEPTTTKPGATSVPPLETPITIGTPTAPRTPTPTAAGTSVSGIPLDPEAKRGGVIHIATATDGPTFSSWEEASSIIFTVGPPTHNWLVRARVWGTQEDWKESAFFELYPDLATSWEQSTDGLQWTFKIRDGITWSDGTPLTCADAQWSFDTIRTGEGLRQSPRATQFLAVDKIQCADDHTLVFKLKYPKAGFLEVIGMPYNLVRPKHVYANNMDALRKDSPTVTSGPFTIKQRITGEKYVLERNPKYWDAPLPYLDGIEVQITPSNTVPTAMRAGRLDMGASASFMGGQADTLVRECTVCQVWPRFIAYNLTPTMIIHKQRMPWSDPRVGDALSLAIDRKKLAQVGYQGWNIVPKGCGFYPQSEWAMPDDRCSKIPGYDFDNASQNQQKAVEILRTLGYNAGDLKLTLPYWNTANVSSALPSIVEDLGKVGISVDPKPMETALAYTTWTDGTFDVGLHYFVVGGTDPDVVLYEHFYTGSDRNYGRYSNPEFDRAADLASQTLDPVLRRQRSWDAMEIALRDQTKMWLGFNTSAPIYNQRLRGFIPSVYSYYLQNRHDTTWVTQQ